MVPARSNRSVTKNDSPRLDYTDLLKVVRLMNRDQRAVEEMLRRMVFNLRTLNRDDHLKNHAFLLDRSGAWQLAPAYDLSFSGGPGGEHTLLVGDEGRRPGRVHFDLVAAKVGIKLKRAPADLYAILTQNPLLRNGVLTPARCTFVASDKRSSRCSISFTSAWAWAVSPCLRWPSAVWSGCDMPLFDLILGATVAAALFAYLGAALLRPDRF